MKYPTIVADPPWPLEYHGGGTRYGGTWHEAVYTSRRPVGLGYPTMSVKEIAALRVDVLASSNAHLYLWIPDAFLIAGDGAKVEHVHVDAASA